MNKKMDSFYLSNSQKMIYNIRLKTQSFHESNGVS